MAVLPITAAVSLLLFCTGAVPEEDPDRLRPSGPPPERLGDWSVPALIPNSAVMGPNEEGPKVDPAALNVQALADAATGSGAGSGRGAARAAFTLTAADKGIPTHMLTAYRKASDRLAADRPRCHLPWELLAGIGKVESGHATGRPITSDGTIIRPIIGLPLDGRGGRALIRDSDNGTLDGDTTYDRAVGPMQFIPTTWRTSGRDGSDDHRNDPHNIYDATVAAGHYLCARDRDLTNPAHLRAAVFSYNPSDDYVRAVLAWMTGYRSGGATPLPGTTTPTGDPSIDAIPIVSLTARPPAPNPAASPPPPLASPPVTAPTGTGRPATPTTPIPTAPTSPPAGPTTVVPPPPPPPPPPSGCPTITLTTADLAIALADLDPAIPGYEALDLTTTRTPQTPGPLTIRAEARATAGQPVVTTHTALPEGAFVAGQPTLIARLPGHRIATAALPDRTLTIALSIEAADDCPGRALLTLRVRNVAPDTFTPPARTPDPPPPVPPAPSSTPAPATTGANPASTASGTPVSVPPPAAVPAAPPPAATSRAITPLTPGAGEGGPRPMSGAP